MNNKTPISKITAICLKTLTGHDSAVYALSPYKGKNSFLSAGGEGWIAEWNHEDSENGQLLAKTSSNLFSLKYVEKEDLIFAGDINGNLHQIDIKTEDRTKSYSFHKKGIFGIYSIDKRLLSLGGDGLLSRLDLGSNDRIDSFQLSYHRLRGFAESYHKNKLIIGSSDKNIYILEKNDLSIQESIINAHENSVFSLALSKDETLLLSGGRDAVLKIWEWKEKLIYVKAIPAHLFTINAINFSPDNRVFATASRDKTIKIWDSSDFKLLKVLESIRDRGHVNSVNDLLWLSKNRLISCSDDRTLKIWDISYE